VSGGKSPYEISEQKFQITAGTPHRDSVW
jgi:hypothetical protein